MSTGTHCGGAGGGGSAAVSCHTGQDAFNVKGKRREEEGAVRPLQSGRVIKAASEEWMRVGEGSAWSVDGEAEEGRSAMC